MYRFTIRELVLVTAFVAIGCAAMTYPGLAWSMALSLCALIAFMAAMVVAIVDRGRPQAVALGFLACFVLYRFLLTSTLPYALSLPTDTIIQWLSRFHAPNSVHPFVFMGLGHLWCALLIGYFGGRLADWVYCRRLQRAVPNAAGT